MGAVGYVIACVLMAVIYFRGKTYFKRYRLLVDKVKDGWGAMAVATFLIYVMLIFIATNPKPLAQRVEYLPNFAIVSVTVLAFYGVFITSLVQKRKLSELNIQLMEEKKWHTIAYQDGLTKLDNRMSYMERINTIEREMSENDILHAVIMDIDNFKRINDSLGHHFGNITLQKTADFIRKYFPQESYESFRIGGDEFAVIAKNVSSHDIDTHIKHLEKISGGEIGCTLSIGFTQVVFGQNRALETAFELADQNMYSMKEAKNKK
ncbi:MAG: GGDEF domain-containing protein [Clostridia bacterium]|nr:GGDEF domain-containing protein [Clostridia bacterium]